MKIAKKLSPLVLVILVSVFVRIAASFYLGDQVDSLPGTADQVSYHALALRVLGGHGFTFAENWWPATRAGDPTAHWSYLYTLYLTAIYQVFGPHPLVARLLQAIAVGMAQPWLAYKLTEIVLKPKQTGKTSTVKEPSVPSRAPLLSRMQDLLNADYLDVPLLAAGITAIYAYFVYYAATLMTEPFYIVALLLTFYLVIRLNRSDTPQSRTAISFALGVSMAVAVLLRQLFMLMIPLIVLWLLVAAYKAKSSIRHIARPTLLSLAIVGLAVLPATVYNYARFDRFLLLNTNAGFAFYLSNHPSYGTQFTPASEMDRSYQEMIPDSLRELNEAELDAALLKRGLQIVADDPVRYLRLSMSRIPIYFEFLPDPRSSALSNIARLSSFGLFLPFILIGLFGSLLRRDPAGGTFRLRVVSDGLVLLYLFIISYSGVHILSWVQVRYRLPVDAVLVIFAAIGIHLALHRLPGLLGMGPPGAKAIRNYTS